MSISQNTSPDTIRIGIVEDDTMIRESLQMLINGSPGFTLVATYANGDDALAGLAKVQPEVVLMDIDLPGINGIECIISLKELNLPMAFIMLTIFEDAEAIFNSLSAGASGYLLKQTPPAELLQAIQEVHQGGSPMSSEIARKVVESFQKQEIASEEMSGLTEREEEVLSYLAKGFMYKEIAELLFISIDTVRSHIRHIYEKLQVKTRTEAILKYLNK
jgi:DNA-binding NarL/FixJ family response regulator